jgi:hypothetical protein
MCSHMQCVVCQFKLSFTGLYNEREPPKEGWLPAQVQLFWLIYN